MNKSCSSINLIGKSASFGITITQWEISNSLSTRESARKKRCSPLKLQLRRCITRGGAHLRDYALKTNVEICSQTTVFQNYMRPENAQATPCAPQHCSSWNPEIHLTLETTHKEIAAKESLQLHPYVSWKVGGWDMKITSLQNMQDSAFNKRYAEFAAGFKMLDESTASKDFSRCSNEVIRTCSHTRSIVQCVCPHYSLKDSQNPITTPPLIASHLNITAFKTVIIDTHDAEISLLITSKKQIQMAQVVIDPPCSLHATAVNYSCLEA
ncbi:hypothetical protein COOONC_01152 [Cooperia oncophora]